MVVDVATGKRTRADATTRRRAGCLRQRALRWSSTAGRSSRPPTRTANSCGWCASISRAANTRPLSGHIPWDVDRAGPDQGRQAARRRSSTKTGSAASRSSMRAPARSGGARRCRPGSATGDRVARQRARPGGDDGLGADVGRCLRRGRAARGASSAGPRASSAASTSAICPSPRSSNGGASTAARSPGCSTARRRDSPAAVRSSSTSTAGPRPRPAPGSRGATTTCSSSSVSRCVYPNVRGSTGYGKTFTKLDNGQLREDSVKDIGALLDWIPSRADLDAERVMVSGGSYGGYMSLAVAVRYARKHPLLGRHRRHLQLRHVPGAHRSLPPRSAARRIRRRARSGHPRLHGADRAGQQRRQDQQADPDRAGKERPARAARRIRADGRDAAKARHHRSGT